MNTCELYPSSGKPTVHLSIEDFSPPEKRLWNDNCSIYKNNGNTASYHLLGWLLCRWLWCNSNKTGLLAGTAGICSTRILGLPAAFKQQAATATDIGRLAGRQSMMGVETSVWEVLTRLLDGKSWKEVSLF